MTFKIKDCLACDHAAMDMDMDPYCTAPEVLAENPHGSLISSERVQRLCPLPEKPLWTVRRKR